MIGDPARAKGLVHFLTHSLRLKSTPRTGWLDRGIPEEETESVADHRPANWEFLGRGRKRT